MKELLKLKAGINLATVLESPVWTYLNERLSKTLLATRNESPISSVSTSWKREMTDLKKTLLNDPSVHNLVESMYGEVDLYESYINGLSNKLHVGCLIYGDIRDGTLYPLIDEVTRSTADAMYKVVEKLNPSNVPEITLYLAALLNVYLQIDK